MIVRFARDTVPEVTLLLIGIAWLYVVLMVALVEATGPGGSLLGAASTLLFWGALPVAIVGYLAFAPARRRRRRAAEVGSAEVGAPEADRGGHPAGDAVAPEREAP